MTDTILLEARVTPEKEVFYVGLGSLQYFLAFPERNLYVVSHDYLHEGRTFGNMNDFKKYVKKTYDLQVKLHD